MIALFTFCSLMSMIFCIIFTEMYDVNICNVFIGVNDSDICILFIEVYDIINFAFNSLRCMLSIFAIYSLRLMIK